ncbi:MAG: hypothetical protein KatS3mg115_1109 [Candidatus Poribacteria bacterium]|nr:MAG: hypothetical protein KatS3mg115_1109 [Candidatus Poribacteria bacterium]
MSRSTKLSSFERARWRAVLLGAALIPPNAYWIMQVEGVWNTGLSTGLSLMWHVVVNLLALMLINLLLQRWAPRWALTAAELLVVYAMLTLAGAIAGRDSYQILIPVMGWAFRFATPENEWASLFHRYLPEWFTLRDPQTLEHLFEGDSTLYLRSHLKALWRPVVAWTGFVLLLAWTLLCANVLLRKQWTQRERLSYPIIQLPLAIVQDGGNVAFFRNRLLWLGFALAGGLDLLNGLSYLFPVVPRVPITYLDHDLGRLFTSKPWNAVGRIPFPMYPFAAALGFFLPLDLAFSIWFFYLVRKLQQVLAAALGLRVLPGFPYLNQQSTGAWLGVFFLVTWMGRGQIREILRRAIWNDPRVDDSEEPIGYRGALLGLVMGLVALGVVCLGMGMSLWIVPPFFGIWMMLSVAIARARAELGPPTHELVGMNPGNMMVDLLGTRRIGPNNLSIFPLFWWFAGRGYRDHLMPHMLEHLKMAEVLRVENRRLMGASLVAVAIGSLSAFWALLHLSFQEGLGHIPIGHDSGVFRALASRLTLPQGSDPGATLFMGVGAGVTFLLMFLRTRFLWWPLHPAGYALSMNFGVDYIWSCLIFSTVAKFLLLRFGGIRAYRRAIPFALGLILGEYTVGAGWSLLATILKRRMYSFYYA